LGPTTFGRPVGLLMLKDGSLLFSDDANHRIYQVQYNQSSNSSSNQTISSSSSQSYFISIMLFIICGIWCS